MSLSSTRNITNFDLILSSCQIVEDSQEEPVLTSAMIQEAFAESKIEFGQKGSVIYTMVLTFWAFLSEFFFTGSERSTTAAVIRISHLLVNFGEEGCSLNNGRYCTVRSKIPEEVPKILAKKMALNTSRNLKEEELWNGHHVGLLDGTTFYAQDTESIQEKYPQSLSQKQGVGFPIIRGVAITSRETGMLHDIAIGPWRGKETGEMALFRSFIYKLKYNSNNLDLFVADRYFCTYFVFALLMQNDIQFLARLHHRRKLEEEDGKKVRKLSNGDLIVRWDLPTKPAWMDEETYAAMPESLQLRLVKIRVEVRGSRTENFYVATTLLDTDKYDQESICRLYHERWNIELDFNAFKTSMKMDRFRGKSPEMVHTELWMGILTYNIVRHLMFRSARKQKINPRYLSFTMAYKLISNGYQNMPINDHFSYMNQYSYNIDHLPDQKVGNRPGRMEPRMMKRRQKPYDLLMEPRSVARQRLIDKTERIPKQEGPGKIIRKKPHYPSIEAVSTKKNTL